jgi:hypothetical protein
MRKRYRKILAQLPMKIEAEDIGHWGPMIFPHLTCEKGDAETLWERLASGDAISVPTLMFKEENLAVELRGECLRITTRRGDFSQEAREYAEKNWGDRLISGEQTQGIKVYLVDPRSGAVEKCFYILLSKPMSILNRKKPEPKSRSIDKAIVDASPDKLVFLEWEKKKCAVAPAFYHCNSCGCGFDALLRCKGCGERFAFDTEDFPFKWPGLGCPLPSKISSLLKGEMGEGYFSTDPVIFRAKEARAQ